MRSSTTLDAHPDARQRPTLATQSQARFRKFSRAKTGRFSRQYRKIAFIVSTLFPLVFIMAPITRAADETEGDPAHDHAHDHEHNEHDVVETIVVTASPLEHDRDELAIPVARIERDALLENLGSTLGETINRVPGVASTGFTAGASRPVIRGQNAFRTEVLEDGLRTQDVSQESPDHAVPVNPLVAQRVEIVRGPATLRYGGGASAGVVNVITNRVPDRNREEGISGEVFGGLGLVADERDFAASFDGRRGELAFHADGVFRRSDDYSIPNNERPRIQSSTGTESWIGSIGTAWLGEKSRLGGSYTRVENKYGIPNDQESVDIDMHADRFRFEGDLLEAFDFAPEIRVRGVYTNYKHDEVEDGVAGQTYYNDEFDGRIEMLHRPVLGFVGAVGIHTQYRDLKAKGEAAEFLAPTDRSVGALYLFEEYKLASETHVELGFRVEQSRVEGTDIDDVDQDRHFTALSGALGFVHDPTDWLTLAINGAVSQRAPSQSELLARGAHEATNTFEIGDPDLDLETSYSGDFRVEARNDVGRLEWTSFVTHYDDYIFAALDGLRVDEDGTPDPNGELDRLFYINRDALFYGFEVAGDVDVHENDHGTFALDGRFDYVRARFDDRGSAGGSRHVPRITPIRWGLGFSFRGESTRARFGFSRTEAQNDTGDFETSTKSFTYLEASLTHTLDWSNEVPIDLSIVGRNLSDVRGRNNVSFNKDDVILPGRNVRFSIRARF
jgi:iron complex outermembrane receptor protein